MPTDNPLYCLHCQQVLTETQKFCHNCGTPKGSTVSPFRSADDIDPRDVSGNYKNRVACRNCGEKPDQLHRRITKDGKSAFFCGRCVEQYDHLVATVQAIETPIADRPPKAPETIAPQPPPKQNERRPVWELVQADMRARDAQGLAKYGTRLQPFNGRDALIDAYQEALDLVVYLRQALYERTGT